jgi:hypothetical protein
MASVSLAAGAAVDPAGMAPPESAGEKPVVASAIGNVLSDDNNTPMYACADYYTNRVCVRAYIVFTCVCV